MKNEKRNTEGFAHKAGMPQSRLRAVVAVNEKDRVQCQQDGCGHSVYAAIHVVEEDGRLLILGSTCFAKRYGTAHALGHAQYGGGNGRRLTEEERLMLIQNTATLLSRFEAQAAAEAEAVALLEEKKRAEALAHKQLMVDKLHRLRATYDDHQTKGARQTPPGLGLRKLSPWPWQKESSSVALFTAPGGAHWVRVQHRDGSQKLVPWPEFPGWESFLPTAIGVPDAAIGAIAVNDIVEAIQILKKNRYKGPVVGRWQDVLPRRISR